MVIFLGALKSGAPKLPRVEGNGLVFEMIITNSTNAYEINCKVWTHKKKNQTKHREKSRIELVLVNVCLCASQSLRLLRPRGNLPLGTSALFVGPHARRCTQAAWPSQNPIEDPTTLILDTEQVVADLQAAGFTAAQASAVKIALLRTHANTSAVTTDMALVKQNIEHLIIRQVSKSNTALPAALFERANTCTLTSVTANCGAHT